MMATLTSFSSGADECVLLDTQAFDQFLDNKENFISRFDEIKDTFAAICETLLENWKGEGAQTFRDKESTITQNAGAIGDILKQMCDTLQECKEIFIECDRQLGVYNAGGE